MKAIEDGYNEIDTKDDAIRTVFDSWEKISCFIEGKQYKVKVATNTVSDISVILSDVAEKLKKDKE